MPPKPPTKRQVAAKRKPLPPPAKRSAQAMESAYSTQWNSPYVRDTLGVPAGVGMMAAPMQSESFAEYDPSDRTIYANVMRDPRMYPMAGATPADLPSERNILTHELGHAYGRSTFPSLKGPMLAPKPTGPLTAREEEARALLSSYGQTSEAEALAQAYTNAAGFLSETAGDTTDFRNKLGRYEGNTPGAGAIVRNLLTARPIYQQHPLRGVIR